jgi:MoxR-like ATPase
MEQEVAAIGDRVKEASGFVYRLREEIGKVVVGQRYVVDRLLVGLLANGHLLLEGVPGLAKTLSVKTLAETIDASFRRIQFTPDLLPADLIGTLIYNPRDGDFTVRRGPIFANIILADEINRAPAKVQSALLEAMQERQVTIGMRPSGCPSPFSFSPRRTPSNRKGPIRCRKRRWTAS